MYHKLKTKPFLHKNVNQVFNEKVLTNSINYVAENIPFSIFPYFKYGISSKKSLKNTSSGNCIALSMGIKLYLEQHHNIFSNLIPATIPKKYQQSGYLAISHVAIAIIGNHKLYIIDPAFYFIKPMVIPASDFKYNKSNQYTCQMIDIYKNNIDDLIYSLKKTEERFILNDYQTIPKSTYFIETYNICDPNDKWNYFVREISNPDQAINSFFIPLKVASPFITITRYHNNFLQCELFLRLHKNNIIEIQHYNRLLYKGSADKIPDNLLHHISKLLSRYAVGSYKEFLSFDYIK